MEKNTSFLEDTGIKFQISIHEHPVWVKVYYLNPETFKSAPLFLLSTDLPENDYVSQTITHHLYDANVATKVAQFILLGVGGAKLMDEIGFNPDVYHLNEAHGISSAFYLYNKFGNIDEVMRYAPPLGHGHLVGANVEAAVDGGGIAVDDLAAQPFGERNTECALANGSGSEDCDEVLTPVLALAPELDLAFHDDIEPVAGFALVEEHLPTPQAGAGHVGDQHARGLLVEGSKQGCFTDHSLVHARHSAMTALHMRDVGHVVRRQHDPAARAAVQIRLSR